jgi:hypothetical protein
VGEVPGAKPFSRCPMSSRGRGGLVRKEKTEAASENTPSASPVTQKPRRQVTSAQDPASHAPTAPPTSSRQRNGRALRSKPTGTLTSLPSTHASKAPYQIAHPNPDVASRAPHKP